MSRPIRFRRAAFPRPFSFHGEIVPGIASEKIAGYELAIDSLAAITVYGWPLSPA